METFFPPKERVNFKFLFEIDSLSSEACFVKLLNFHLDLISYKFNYLFLLNFLEFFKTVPQGLLGEPGLDFLPSPPP